MATDDHTEQIHDKQFVTFSRAQRLARFLLDLIRDLFLLVVSQLGVLIYDPLCKFLRRFPCGRRRRLGQPLEDEKIAVRKGSRAACLAGLIHLIPMGVSLFLVVYNLQGHYVGGELEGVVGQDDIKFLLIQFGSKLHELLISASVTTVILSYIQRNIIADKGLPFGAIFAGLQFKDLSYLVSREFWGAACAGCLRVWDKGILVVLIVVGAFLAVSAGPASATLMRPRLDYWPAGGTDFWIALSKNEWNSTNASATLVPATCMNDTGNLGCPSGGWQTLAQDYLSFYRYRRREGYLPDYTYVPGQKAVLAIRTWTRSTDFQFNENSTRATVGISSVADGLVETGRLWAWAAYNWRFNGSSERFWSRIDVVYSVEAQQPIVHVRCMEYNASNDSSGSTLDTSASTIAVYDLSDQDHLDSNGDFRTLEYNYTGDERVGSLIQNAFNSESVPQVAWATVRQSNNGSALGATLNVPMEGINASKLFQCTIDARMAPGTLQSTRNNVSLVTGFDSNSTYRDRNTFPRISIEPAWAAFLNPIISPGGSTAFQYMMQAAGILNDGYVIDPGSITYAIESLLSLSVVNGLARRHFGAGFSGTLLGNTDGLDLVSYRDYLDPDKVGDYDLDCDEWCGHLMPTGAAMGPGGNAFNISETKKVANPKFTMRAGAQGYAFNARGVSSKFAMVVLLLYFTTALIHLAYSILYRKTSSSWSSISELVALAMRSESPEAFENTGAGIDSDAIFEERTRIVDRDGGLQLAVGNPEDSDHLVEPDKKYR